MTQLSDAILLESLDLLESGETIESILARYPQVADELAPFLQTAVGLTTLSTQPTLAAKRQSQARFLAEAGALSEPAVVPIPIWGVLRRLFVPVMALLVVMLLAGSALVSASTTAVPGDALYATKRFVERVQLGLTSDPDALRALAAEQAAERVREVEALVRAGRVADVTFDGTIDAIGPTRWTVAGITILIDPATQIEGNPQIGELARVMGRTGSDGVDADRILVLTGSGPEPEPTPVPAVVPSETPPATPTPTVTVEPTATSTPSPTATPTSTETSTPTVEPTATTLPTQPPPPPDNGPGDNDNDGDGDSNDNDGGGGNENEGGDDNANDGDDDNANDGDDDNANDGDDENANDGDDDNSNDGDNENDNEGESDDSGGNSGSGGGSDDGSDNDDGNDNGGDDGDELD